MDIHLGNALIGLNRSIDHLSTDAYCEKFSEPDTVPVTRADGLPLTANVPSVATRPRSIQKNAEDLTPDDARRLVLCDFGEAFNPSTTSRTGKESRTPWAKRAPEAFFEPERALSYPSDIWSLGISIWDIVGTNDIFSSDLASRDEIIAAQIEVLGWDELPSAWQDIWNRPKTKEGDEYSLPRAPHPKSEPSPPLEQAFEKIVQEYRREFPEYGIFEADETAAILALMRGMLKLDPRKRMTMDEVLQSEWMLKWAMPELRKAMDESSVDTSQLTWPPFDQRNK
jgi:serine/threonine protein kinase